MGKNIIVSGNMTNHMTKKYPHLVKMYPKWRAAAKKVEGYKVPSYTKSQKSNIEVAAWSTSALTTSSLGSALSQTYMSLMVY